MNVYGIIITRGLHFEMLESAARTCTVQQVPGNSGRMRSEKSKKGGNIALGNIILLKMFVTLTSAQHAQIFDILRIVYKDFGPFDILVADKLREALKDSNSVDINFVNTKSIVKRYFCVNQFGKSERKALMFTLQLIFQSAYVLVISLSNAANYTQLSCVEEFLAIYPQFADEKINDLERQYLLNYCNIIRTALTIIPAEKNQGRLVQLAGKLDGSGKEYITGSGQKVEVSRREAIYRQEGKLPAVESAPKVIKVKPEKVTVAAAGGSKEKKRKGGGPLVCSSSSFCVKKMRMMTITTDVQRLVKSDGIAALEPPSLGVAALRLSDESGHGSQRPPVAASVPVLSQTPCALPSASLNKLLAFSPPSSPLSLGRDKSEDFWLTDSQQQRFLDLESAESSQTVMLEGGYDSGGLLSGGLTSDAFSCWGECYEGGLYFHPVAVPSLPAPQQQQYQHQQCVQDASNMWDALDELQNLCGGR